jgi:SAM-dependent methyltransferase
MDLKEEEILGDQIRSHWYYKAKAAAVVRELHDIRPREILDIGAGSGYFSRVLLEKTAAGRATCVDIGYPQDSDGTCNGKPIAFRRAIDKSDADLVLAMDVMEHVPDETALMSPYVRGVASGTRFIISVPAFDFLWSSHDVFLGHYRRYTLKGLEDTVRRCGLTIDKSHYYFGAVFPIAAGLRLLERAGKGEPKSQLRQHSRLVNGGLSTLCALERPLMDFNRLFGLTVFAICHKP